MIFRLLPLLGGLASAAAPSRVVLCGRIMGASGEHSVRVALWREAGFLAEPAQELVLPPGVVEFRFEIPPGRWALSAFEDRDGNGVLAMGPFGPKEPAGFWRPFHRWRRPRFDEVAVEVDRDILDADIRLR